MKNGIVTVKQGRLQGYPGKNPAITVFKGVPYAQPPVGSLRWRAPRPMSSWYGVRDAGQFGAMAVQVKGAFLDAGKFQDIYQAEDCLHVNIWTPAAAGDEKLPVLVWYYGGGLQGGYAHDPMFDGEYLASKGIILVTVNYRVGLLGFLCHPDMRKESSYGTSGNFGLQDQAAALQWIHENIAAFGGNPAKVTIAGQSAGGGSVCNLMCSPIAKGLFHAAIVESGDCLHYGGEEFNPTMERAEYVGRRISDYFGGATLDELRKIPIEKLVWEDDDIANVAAHAHCVAVVDGTVLPKKPSDIILNGEENSRVPLLMGSNSDEGLGFFADSVDSYRRLLKVFGNFADKIEAQYQVKTDDDVAKVVERLAADQWHARLRCLNLARKHAGLQSWQYYLTQGMTIKGLHMGARHSGELGFIFGTSYILDEALSCILPKELLDSNYDSTEDERITKNLTELMSDYWVNFVKFGDPNGDNVPAWNSDPIEGSYMLFEADNCGTKADRNEERQILLFQEAAAHYHIPIE